MCEIYELRKLKRNELTGRVDDNGDVGIGDDVDGLRASGSSRADGLGILIKLRRRRGFGILRGGNRGVRGCDGEDGMAEGIDCGRGDWMVCCVMTGGVGGFDAGDGGVRGIGSGSPVRSTEVRKE